MYPSNDGMVRIISLHGPGFGRRPRAAHARHSGSADQLALSRSRRSEDIHALQADGEVCASQGRAGPGSSESPSPLRLATKVFRVNNVEEVPE